MAVVIVYLYLRTKWTPQT